MIHLCAVFLLAALPIQDEIGQSISDSFQVRLISIEVVVTDREGKLVSGLGREDFKLLVDGAQVDTTYFEEINASKRSQAPGETRLGVAKPGNFFLVFIDDYFTEPLFRKPMFERLYADLDKMGPSDKMAVVRYKGKQLETLIGWSNDREALGLALQRGREMKSGYMQREMRLRVSGRDKGRSRNEQIKKVVSSISVAMRGFYQSGVRQNLVLVSSGWPVIPDFNEEANLFDVSRYYGVGQLRPITDTANQLGYTIYPMQMQLPDLEVPDTYTETLGEAATPYYSAFSVSLDSLSFLSDETGGLLYSKALALKNPLKQAIEDTHGYYSLGFSREDRGSDRHGIKIQVKGSGLKVRYRKNFRFLSQSDEADMRTESAMLFGDAASSLEVRFGEPEKKGRGKVILPVTIDIPMDWATAKPLHGFYHTNLELRTLSEDKDGNRSEMSTEAISFSGPKPTPGAVASYAFTLLMRKKTHRLVFTLKDIATGSLRVATISVDPKMRR